MKKETGKYIDPKDGFFDSLQEWKEEWEGMPEFKTEDLTSYKKISIHFRNKEDVEEFSKLIKQRITPGGLYIWYPYMPPRKVKHLKYILEKKSEK